jgi:hypothetical protein
MLLLTARGSLIGFSSLNQCRIPFAQRRMRIGPCGAAPSAGRRRFSDFLEFEVHNGRDVLAFARWFNAYHIASIVCCILQAVILVFTLTIIHLLLCRQPKAKRIASKPSTMMLLLQTLRKKRRNS